jgi:membrane protein implicated in regulation of membrane protease activity
MEFFAAFSLLTVFLIIGAIGLAFLLISFIVGDIFDLIGLNFDVANDDFGLLDSRVISIFLTAFGGFGAIASKLGFGAFPSSMFGLLGGAILGYIVYRFGKLLYQQQSTSSVTNEDFIGRTAKVTVAIMPNQIGQITFLIGEERVEKLARSIDNLEIPLGATVKVDSFAGDSILVRADKGEGFLLFTEKE